MHNHSSKVELSAETSLTREEIAVVCLLALRSKKSLKTTNKEVGHGADSNPPG
jgi:hypothetical protein